MSHDDHRPGPNGSRERGAYTPPTDDDLPFNRTFDARRAPPSKAPPVTLIVSGLVLVGIVIAILLLQPWKTRASTDAPPALGQPVGALKVEAPADAQPVDAEAGIDVYRGSTDAPATEPTFTPPPEEVQPRPAPKPLPAPTATLPTPAAPRPTTPAPAPRPAAPAPAATTPAAPTTAATGTSAVQIGAFSTTAIADRQYAAIAGRFPQFASGARKRVQEVQAANGSTVYRTTFTGLSRERAQAFCAAIRSGGGDCLVR